MGRAWIAALEPAAWKALSTPAPLAKPVEGIEGLKAYLAGVGLALEGADSAVIAGRANAGALMSPIEVIEEMTRFQLAGVVAEGRTLRLLPRREALKYWMRRAGTE